MKSKEVFKMKKASDICLIIGGVLAILNAIGFLVASIIMFVFASPAFKQMVIEGLQNGSIKSSLPGTPEEVATALQVVFLGLGCGFLPFFLFAVLSAVFSFIAPKKEQMSSMFLTSYLELSALQLSIQLVELLDF